MTAATFVETTTPPAFLLQCGLEHHQAGRLAEAKALYQQVLAAQHNHADALHLLGVIAHQSGDHETAAARIHHAIALNPNAAAYHANLGNVLQAMGFARDAATCYVRALEIKPNLAEVHANLASVFLEVGFLDQAVTWYHRALALDPSLAVAHYHLGDALRRQSRLEDAATAYNRATDLNPDNADAYHWAGRVSRELGDLPLALEKFRKAKAIDPNHPRAAFSEAMVQILQGDYEAGWRSYECRWTSTDHATPDRAYPQPRWSGEALHSGSLFLWPEQGIGDEIMFAGLLPEVIESGTPCMLACAARLQPLFARSFPTIEVVADRPPAEGEQPSLPQHIQAQLPTGSLPGLYRNSAASFERSSPRYLIPDAAQRNVLRASYADGRRVAGLAWSSNNVKTGAARSIDLTMLAPLFTRPDTRWISLQYGEAAVLRGQIASAHAPVLVDDQVDQLADMDTFAAQVAAMDLVITIDNTTAHLAGALGVPVWLLLPSAPDWRWLATGSECPWYPSMRIFRQPQRGDWAAVIEDVRIALASSSATTKAPGRRAGGASRGFGRFA